MRIAAGVEYDGSQYHGWQRQKGVASVQEKVELALSEVANHSVQVICAGRTDTGVHGVGQVIHFDAKVKRSERAWVFGSNSNLPQDICVRWATEVSDDFHARFKAFSRHYRYIIYNSPVRPALMRTQLTWHYKPLDIERMNNAAAHLIGRHDFTSYRALNCQANTPVRTIEKLSVTRQESLVIIDIKANAFLHHMVRNIAGVLLEIGGGEKEPEWAREVLDFRDRSLGGVTAPPYGLYFIKVHYPEPFKFPEESLGPHFLTGINTLEEA